MAKGKYHEWITPDGLLLLSAWARDGLTDAQISKKMGIAPKTLWQWKTAHSSLGNALKNTKEVVDITVENALYKKTQGYTVQLIKTFKLRSADYDLVTGKKTREWEELKEGIEEIHVPADTMAQLAWLNNRKPEKWRRNAGKEKLDEKKFDLDKDKADREAW